MEEDQDLEHGERQQRQAGNEYFSVPGHMPVIFSEVGGRNLYRNAAR